MDVGRICTREVDLAEPDETAVVAAQRMLQRNVGSLVVLDAKKKPVGIVTDRDLCLRVMAKGVDAAQVQVRDVLTPHPHCIPEHASVNGALGLMRDVGVRRVLVVDGDQHLVGLLALDDIVDVLCEQGALVRAVIAKEGPRTLS